ncbi:LacI family DNA-binding transcriptional regulator [Paenibacillus elgii]
MSRLDEVAKRAGVSKSTVSRVINNSGTVSPAARQKVQEAMRELHFHAEELRRSPEGSATIGLILPFGKHIASHSFGVDIMAGAEEKAFEQDYMILIGNSFGGREVALTSKMISRGVEGIIVLSGDQKNREHAELLAASGIPMVLVDQKLEGVEAHLVRGDNFMGSVALMNHLLSLGHRRIALLSPNRHYTHRERVKGYRFALMEQELEVPPSYEVLLESGVSPEAELRALLRSEDRPTAVYAADPGHLGMLIGVANELRLRIPEELSVVTFDDTYAVLPEGYADFFTSVNQSGKLMGSMAVELLFRQWRDPELGVQEIVLPGKLNVRRSTRRF